MISQFFKCSFGVPFGSTVTLPDGALRVQEHATGSALDGHPFLRECIFPRLQGEETIPMLSEGQ